MLMSDRGQVPVRPQSRANASDRYLSPVRFGFTDLCEMKHSSSIFTIDKDYAKELQNKQDAYQQLSKDKRTLCSR